MVVTHCGSDIVGTDGQEAAARIRNLARECGVAVEIASDGMERAYV
jgi:hypothetical protein